MQHGQVSQNKYNPCQAKLKITAVGYASKLCVFKQRYLKVANQ